MLRMPARCVLCAMFMVLWSHELLICWEWTLCGARRVCSHFQEFSSNQTKYIRQSMMAWFTYHLWSWHPQRYMDKARSSCKAIRLVSKITSDHGTHNATWTKHARQAKQFVLIQKPPLIIVPTKQRGFCNGQSTLVWQHIMIDV